MSDYQIQYDFGMGNQVSEKEKLIAANHGRFRQWDAAPLISSALLHHPNAEYSCRSSATICQKNASFSGQLLAK